MIKLKLLLGGYQRATNAGRLLQGTWIIEKKIFYNINKRNIDTDKKNIRLRNWGVGETNNSDIIINTFF